MGRMTDARKRARQKGAGAPTPPKPTFTTIPLPAPLPSPLDGTASHTSGGRQADWPATGCDAVPASRGTGRAGRPRCSQAHCSAGCCSDASSGRGRGSRKRRG